MHTDIAPEAASAGELASFELSLRPEEAIRSGGHVRIRAFHKVANYWRQAQARFPRRENYVTARFPPEVRGSLLLDDGGWVLVLHIESGHVRPGQGITVCFGDRSMGSPGWRLSALAGVARLRVFSRADDESEEVEHAEVNVTIRPGSPDRLCVRTSGIGEDNSVSLRAAALDRCGNVAVDAPILLSVEPVAGAVCEGSLAFPTHGKALTETRVSFDDCPPTRIEVAATGKELKALSDPVHPTRSVFWGDLHAHTNLGQALETPEFLYACAREDAALDFLCHVEHYCAGAERWIGEEWRRWPTHPASIETYIFEAWQRQQELVSSHDEPGRFVPLLGYEWSSNIYGHMNVVLAETEGDVNYPGSFWDERFTPEDLFAQLSETEALVIPHHPSWPVNQGRSVSGVDWRFCDRRLTRLVEICSKHGVSEFFGCPDAVPSQSPEGTVRCALGRGHRLGFVGSTDTHASRPGSHGLEGDLWAPRGGLTAVFAERLDRPSIFAALRDRRCYATTGARIILDVELNREPMGSELSLHNGEERLIACKLWGTAPIACAEIVRDGEAVHRRTPASDTASLAFEFTDRAVMETGSHYYLRVLQADGHQAWSSPIWVDPSR